jgi:hypothetical protein
MGQQGTDIVYLNTGDTLKIYGWQNGLAAFYAGQLQDADRFWVNIAPLI